MPRNSSGSYSLPPGNPVVNGTVIDPSWANTTLADVATETTNSLDRNGRGPMLAALALADGTATTPGLTFNSEPTTGLYRAGANDVRLQVAGTTVVQALPTGPVVPLGLTATQTQANTAAVTATGNGTATGVLATGGVGGGPGLTGAGTVAAAGVVATGGSSGGAGVVATGGGTGAGVVGTGGTGGAGGVVGAGVLAGVGVTGTGGATNAAGLSGTGGGSGPGLTATGGSSNGSGVVAVGGGTSGVGLRATGTASGTAATLVHGGTGAPTLLVTGDVTSAQQGVQIIGNITQTNAHAALAVAGTAAASSFLVTNPPLTGSTAYQNTLTTENFPKVLCTATTQSSSPYTSNDYSFNVAAVTVSGGTSPGSTLNISFAQDMADTNYAVAVALNYSLPTFCQVTSKFAGSCSLSLWGHDGVALTFSASPGIQIMVSVFGRQ